MGGRRALRRLVLELRRHHAAVIGGGRREIGADLRHPPRDRATVAIAGDEDRSLPLQRVDAGLRVLQTLFERMELAREFDSALELRAGIIAFEPRMIAVEQRGGQYLIAVGGIFLA